MKSFSKKTRKIQPKVKQLKKKSSFFSPGFQISETNNKTIETIISSPAFSLSTESKKFFEPKFNYSFDHVKLHTGKIAAQSAEQMNANAYTYGNNIVFNEGKYQPDTKKGSRLLAHELSHIKLHSDPERIFRSPKDDTTIAEPAQDKTSQDELPTSPQVTILACSPIGLDRKSFLSKPHTSQNEFGLTRLDLTAVKHPEIVLVKSGSKFILQNTTSHLPYIPSFYTKDGFFIEGQVHFMGESPCHKGTSKTYPKLWEITTDAAALIEQAEEEHCNDFNYAFSISLEVFTDAINQFAASKTKFNNLAHCKNQLLKKTKVHPDKWESHFNKLAKKSEDRDTNKWHLPSFRTIHPDKVSPSQYWCDYVKFLIHKASLPEVGKHPSSSIIVP